MHIILDTNIFVQDFRISGTQFRVLFSALKKTHHVLVVPQVVFDETVNKFRDGVLEAIREAVGPANTLSRLTGRTFGTDITGLDPAPTVAAYAAWLKLELNTAGDDDAEWLPYPKTGHDVLARRALARKRPFDTSGRTGYRDALIWESILEYAAATPKEKIAFVSLNSNDFADSAKKDLHPDLVADVAPRKIPAGNITLFVGLGAFLAAHVEPTLKKLDDMAAKLKGGTFAQLNLLDWLDSNLIGLLRPRGTKDLGLGRDLDEPSIDAVHDIAIEGTPDVRTLSESEVLIGTTIKCDLEVDFYIEKSNYYLWDDDDSKDLRIFDADHNDHMMYGMTMVPVELTLFLTLNTETGAVTSTELVEVSRRPAAVATPS